MFSTIVSRTYLVYIPSWNLVDFINVLVTSNQMFFALCSMLIYYTYNLLVGLFLLQTPK